MDMQPCTPCIQYTFRSAEAQNRLHVCKSPRPDMPLRTAGRHSDYRALKGIASLHSGMCHIPRSGPMSSILQGGHQTLPCLRAHRPYTLCTALNPLPLHTVFFQVHQEMVAPVSQKNV